MKIIITSPHALIDNSTGQMFEGIENALDRFINMNQPNNVVITVSRLQSQLKNIPDKFSPFASWKRGSPKLIEEVKEKWNFSEMIVLGAKIEDVAQAAHSKALLLSAKYAQSNNPTDKLYTKDYGIAISNATALSVFFERFLTITNPWYLKLPITDVSTLYALTNAQQYTQTKEIGDIIGKFIQLLKKGHSQYIGPFTNYFLASIYKIQQEVNSIDFFDAYPTSTGQPNEDLEYFLLKLRQSFNVRPHEPLLIRHQSSPKRQNMSPEDRVRTGCDTQFDSLHLNPVYKNRLNGAAVCIVDDFTTWGVSCETVRNLLEAEGVRKLIFIAMGKFRNYYNQYEYQITGDVYKPGYKYQRLSRTGLKCNFNPESSKEFLDSIKGLV